MTICQLLFQRIPDANYITLLYQVDNNFFSGNISVHVFYLAEKLSHDHPPTTVPVYQP